MVSHNGVGAGLDSGRRRTELSYGEARGARIECDTGTKSISIKITWAVCTDASPHCSFKKTLLLRFTFDIFAFKTVLLFTPGQ